MDGSLLAVTLAECPIGLFWCGETLALKTEYGNNEGRIDAYIVSSGEMFWGPAPQTIASQRATMVVPVDCDDAHRLLTPPIPDQRDVERSADETRFWSIVDASGLAAVPSDMWSALETIVRKAGHYDKLVVALHDAIVSPMGTVPDTAGPYYRGSLAIARQEARLARTLGADHHG